MKVVGRIIEIEHTQEISPKFKKRNFVLEYVENLSGQRYPEFITFECVQEKCELLDNINIADNVEVCFNLRGKKWTTKEGVDKYFNTLQAWRIEKIGLDIGVLERIPGLP